MDCSAKPVPAKIIVDSIHGDIHLNKQELAVIDTPAFQRLRRIKQLQMSQVTYPSATHTRFAHSIGTLGLMARIMWTTDGLGLNKEDKENLRLAALLHDIGHYPYSHLVEGLDNVKLIEEQIGEKKSTVAENQYPSYEELGNTVVTTHASLVKALGSKEKAEEIGNLFTGSSVKNKPFTRLITSSLDLDRLDYLLRDSYAAGVPYGRIDINYLLNSVKLSPEKMLGIENKALPAVEQFLMARFFMHRTVYFHKTTYGMEETCRQLLRRLRDRGDYEIPENAKKIVDKAKSEVEWASFDDSFVDSIVRKAVEDKDGVIKCLAMAINSRKPPKLIKEVSILTEKDQPHHKGSAFKQNVKYKLKDLISKYKLLAGQFLYCELKPLILEKAERQMTHEQWDQMTEPQKQQLREEQQEIIRVFEKDKPEPVSLTTIKHSIVSKFRELSFRIFRLYFVPKSEKELDIVDQIRNTTQSWDQLK